MEIPYTISTRPDTGLWNAKIGIWLFLASEVMLFGGLFSAYVFLRLDAQPGEWPHGLLNVPVGTMNTAILIMSSVTVVLAWAALKMRRYRAYWWYVLPTIRFTSSRTTQRTIVHTFFTFRQPTTSRKLKRKTLSESIHLDRGTVRISRVTSPSPACTARTCSPAFSSLFTCGCP